MQKTATLPNENNDLRSNSFIVLSQKEKTRRKINFRESQQKEDHLKKFLETHTIPFKAWFQFTIEKIPCTECRQHAQQWLNQHPFEFETPEKLERSILNLYNSVRSKLGLPLWSMRNWKMKQKIHLKAEKVEFFHFISDHSPFRNNPLFFPPLSQVQTPSPFSHSSMSSFSAIQISQNSKHVSGLSQNTKQENPSSQGFLLSLSPKEIYQEFKEKRKTKSPFAKPFLTWKRSVETKTKTPKQTGILKQHQDRLFSPVILHPVPRLQQNFVQKKKEETKEVRFGEPLAPTPLLKSDFLSHQHQHSALWIPIQPFVNPDVFGPIIWTSMEIFSFLYKKYFSLHLQKIQQVIVTKNENPNSKPILNHTAEQKSSSKNENLSSVLELPGWARIVLFEHAWIMVSQYPHQNPTDKDKALLKAWMEINFKFGLWSLEKVQAKKLTESFNYDSQKTLAISLLDLYNTFGFSLFNSTDSSFTKCVQKQNLENFSKSQASAFYMIYDDQIEYIPTTHLVEQQQNSNLNTKTQLEFPNNNFEKIQNPKKEKNDTTTSQIFLITDQKIKNSLQEPLKDGNQNLESLENLEEKDKMECEYQFTKDHIDLTLINIVQKGLILFFAAIASIFLLNRSF